MWGLHFKFQQHNVPDIWCYRWLWGTRNTWGRQGRMYFLYLLPRANAFSVAFQQEARRNCIGSRLLLKPECRGSYRGCANWARVHANVVLEVALVVSKGSLKLHSFILIFGGTQDPLGMQPQKRQKPELLLAYPPPSLFVHRYRVSPSCVPTPPF